ncbi:hypothetical protein [Streptomyces sp. IBSNAI001]|uniref:hypothetical protein n=1 Tax=Streptomyces sp. IBSNAI001 TaxID=3457499 RepID=UPI003FD4D622
MFRTTMLATATTAIAAALLLTACSTPDTTDRPAPAAAAPAAAETDRAGHTRQVFTITWNSQTEAQRDTLCDSLVILGPEQSATEMAKGAAHSPEIDWDLMTDLLATECDNR